MCSSLDDQHQQIQCEQCTAWFHLYCLQPPLSRFPKKQKGVGWVCEDCDNENKARRTKEKEDKVVPPNARRARGQPKGAIIDDDTSEKELQAALRSVRS